MTKIPDKILQHLKCSVCRNWLSCGKVKVLKNGESICGRCDAVPTKSFTFYNNYAYEALANYFKFPCRYWTNNCPELLPYDDVLEHEQHCPFQNVCFMFCAVPSAICKPRRKLDLRGDIELELVPDEILQRLKCIHCGGYLSCSPVILRRDGNATCHRCFNQHGVPREDYIQQFAFEELLSMMIFPCMYRLQGCTIKYRFGRNIWTHEVDCPYGHIYSTPKQKGEKERGVIETHTGHVFATLTPNSKNIFAPPSQNTRKISNNGPVEIEKSRLSVEQGQFLNALRRHRSALEEKWKNRRNVTSERVDVTSVRTNLYRSKSEYANGFQMSLMEELKLRQRDKKLIEKAGSAENILCPTPNSPKYGELSIDYMSIFKDVNDEHKNKETVKSRQGRGYSLQKSGQSSFLV